MKLRSKLDTVVDDSIFRTAKYRYSYTMNLTADPDLVWEGLQAVRPLSWCGPLDGVYTSARPFGKGTTREVVVAKTLRLDERFFSWDDENRHHSFFVESASLPFFKVFAEDYRVTPAAAGGCTFVWQFAMESRRGLGFAFHAMQPLTKKLLLDKMVSDTVAHFGGVLSARF